MISNNIKYIYQLFVEQSKQKPDAIAFQSGNERITYRDLDRKSAAVALDLIELGFKPGNIAAVAFQNPLEMAIGILGILKAGGGYLPIDHRNPMDYNCRILQYSRINYYVRSNECKDISKFEGKILVYNAGDDNARLIQDPIIENNPENSMAIFYVSNSTGRPEGIALSHDKILKWLDFNLDKIKVDYTRTLVISNSWLEMSFPMWLCNLSTGGSVYSFNYPAGDKDIFAQLSQLMVEMDFTSIVCPLTFLEILANQENYAKFFTGGLRNIISVGEEAPYFNVTGFKEFLKNRKTEIRWHNYYGFPEISIITTLIEDEFTNKKSLLHTGKPVSGTRAYILNDDLQLVSIGKSGQLYLAGSGILDKYYQNDKLNRHHFVKNGSTPDPIIFKTGYKASWLPDGKLSLMGRVNNTINVNGNRAALEEIEFAFSRHPLIKDCAVIASIQKTGEETLKLTAYIVLKEEVDDNSLEKFLRSILPEDYFPIGFVRLFLLPRTADGFVDRKLLEQFNRIDSLQVRYLEKKISEFPQIDQIAVWVKETVERPVPLHINDYIVDLNTGPSEKNEKQVEIENKIDTKIEKSELAIIQGDELIWEAEEPRILADLLKRAVGQHGDNGIWYIQSDGVTHFQSYASLLEEAERVLTGLRKLGLKTGDKVLFQFNRNDDYVLAFWGCVLGGMVPVPLMIPKSFSKATNESETLRRVWELLEKPLILTDKKSKLPICSLIKDSWGESIEDLKNNEPAKNWHESSPGDLAIILFTSGSTGIPKGVMQCHSSIVSREKSTTAYNQGKHTDVSINWMPLEHVGGVVMFHLSDVFMCCNQIQVSTEYILTDPLRWLDIISQYRGTITWAPNFSYALVSECVEKNLDRNWDLSSMRFILNAGEAINGISSKKFLRLLAPFGLPANAIKPAWGMSETCSGVVYSHLFTSEVEAGIHYLDKESLNKNVVKQNLSRENAVLYVELGKPIPGTSIRIADSANVVVREGIIGRLQIKGATVTPGYYRNPGLNKEVFTADGWFDTGDLAFILNGRMTITGRAKDVIIVNGINFNSVEIEAAIEDVEGVAKSFTAACAIRGQDSDTDRVVIFYHSHFTDFNRILLQIMQIKKKFGEKFGLNLDYAIPLSKEDIPKTSIGKIQRLKLAKLFQEGKFNSILRDIDIGLENENTLPSWFFKKSWRNHHIQFFREPVEDASHTCLVFEDGLGLAKALVPRLENENSRCITVKYGTGFNKFGETCYQINHRESLDYIRLLEDIEKNNIQIHDIFHLACYRKVVSDTSDIETINNFHDEGIYSLLYLIQALAGRKHHTSRLLMVTANTQPVLPTDRTAFENGTIPGFLKSVSLELDWLTCCHIDLDIDMDLTIELYNCHADSLIREWKNPGESQEVAYRAGQRLKPSLDKVDPEKETKRTLPLKKGGIYMVTGGLGGIGPHVCKWLMKHFASHLVIIGRTPLPERNEWPAISKTNTTLSKRIRTYLDLEASQQGGQLLYAAGDVADISFLKQTISLAESQWQSSLDGVFHLAGYGNLEYHWTVMDKHRVINETLQTFQDMFRPKVFGTLGLHQILENRKDAIFVAFSSTTGTFGAATFSAYSAANSFLDNFCFYRKINGYPNTYCLSWSSWDDLGMSLNNPEPMVKAMLANGYRIIKPTQGIHSLAIALQLSPQQIFIGLDGSMRHICAFMFEYPSTHQDINVYYTIKKEMKIDEEKYRQSIMQIISTRDTNKRTLFKVHKIAEMPLREGGFIDYKQLEDISQCLEGGTIATDIPKTETEQQLASIWREILGKRIVGITDNFFEIGGHSLNATTLISKIHKVFDVKISLAEIFRAPTIKELALLINKSVTDTFQTILPVEKREYYLQSSVQKRLYILQQMDLESTAYNIPEVIPLPICPDIGKLNSTFFQLIHRHESLRTSFHMLGNEFVQQVHDNIEFEVQYTQSIFSEKDLKDKLLHFVHAFDLSRAPLVRAELIKIEKEKHLLVVDIHHIISDGVSHEILAKDFMALYEGLTLPPLRIQYKDFSQWQLSQLNKTNSNEQEKFWLNQFEGDIPVLNLPLDYPRPAVQSFAGNVVNFELSPEQSLALNRLSSHLGATLFMKLLAIYNILLAKLSGQEDIIVGTVIAARRHADLEPIIGMFVNTLAIRNFPNPGKTFQDFLIEIKRRTLNAFENQEYPFEELVEHLSINRDISRNPLFDAALALTNMEAQAKEMPPRDIPAQKVKPYEIENKTSKFDLTLVGQEIAGKLFFCFEYCTKLFTAETIQRFINFFKRIIASVIENKDLKISEIEIITEEEKKQVLFDFNNTQAGYPKDKTLHRLFEEQVEKSSDRIALIGAMLSDRPVSDHHHADVTHLTYRKLNDYSNLLAYELRKKSVKSDTIVAMMMERSIDMIVGMLGILKAGGAYLPLDPESPQARVSSTLEDSCSSTLLTQTGILKNHSFTALQGLRNSRVKPYVASPCAPVASMDSLPFPDRSLVSYNTYNRYIGQAMVKHSIVLQGSRGCPYNCAYCHKIWSKKQVVRSAENLYSEVKLYYDMGIRRFVLIDDIFNFNVKSSSDFFRKVIHDRLDVKFFFPNGLRGDILTPDYIDLMVEAGTINLALALETASPRLQRMIRKNLNLDKFQENLDYFQEKYPQVILELFTMHGFPTETEEEAMMTLDFIKRQKWLHFPYVHILKIYPNTDMAELAMANGISKEAIAASANLAYHQLPTTLPFNSSFTLNYQADFLNNYFLSKERLLHVLPFQAAALTQEELVEKYDSYLPADISDFDGFLKFAGIDRRELGDIGFVDEAQVSVPDLDKKIGDNFPVHKPDPGALRILFLDLSQYFSGEGNMLYDVVEPPLGLMYLLTYLYSKFGEKIDGKIAKSKIDFDNYDGLRILLEDFKPDIIGIRTLTFYRDFFHRTVSMIRQWGIDVPILAGGPYATSDFNTLLQDGHIDLAVLGEGEIITAMLVEKILENGKKLPDTAVLKEIPGIAFIPRGKELRGALAPGLIMMDTLLNKPYTGHIENPKPLSHAGDTAYIIFTSGSTGRPKGILVEHRSVVNLICNQVGYFNINNSDRILQFSSICFDASVEQIFIAFSSGAVLVLIDKNTLLDMEKFDKFVFRHQVSHIHAVPSFLNNMQLRNAPQLKRVIAGGDVCPVSLAEKWNGTFDFYNEYGPTETTVTSTEILIKDAKAFLSRLPIGKPIGNTNVYILDRWMKPAPWGVIGELYIGGTGVARGYLNRPELTAEKFGLLMTPMTQMTPIKDQRIYKTGDLARWLSDGNIEFLGRIDSQVKIRGFRIELGEIENRLMAHEAVKDAVVLAAAESGGENSLYAYIVVDGTPQIPELKEFLAQLLPPYMIPTYFIQLEKIPLTPNGKIDRKMLEISGTQEETYGKYIEPTTELERILADIWAEELKHKQIGIDDNFFDIGGNSLHIITITNKLNANLKKNIQVMTLFQYPTIRSLAQYLNPEGSQAKNPIQKEMVETLINRADDSLFDAVQLFE